MKHILLCFAIGFQTACTETSETKDPVPHETQADADGGFDFSDCDGCNLQLNSRDGFAIESGCGVSTCAFLPARINNPPHPLYSSANSSYYWAQQEPFTAGGWPGNGAQWYSFTLSQLDINYLSGGLSLGLWSRRTHRAEILHLRAGVRDVWPIHLPRCS
jgi:hypothetical protein